jgi:ABC-type dipeptide/oligopeptide/nickel transport system ATPase subunit
MGTSEKKSFRKGLNFVIHLNSFKFKAACAESALSSAETGCGKTLIAICLVMLKMAGRVLIVAPKGTVKESEG